MIHFELRATIFNNPFMDLARVNIIHVAQNLGIKDAVLEIVKIDQLIDLSDTPPCPTHYGCYLIIHHCQNHQLVERVVAALRDEDFGLPVMIDRQCQLISACDMFDYGPLTDERI